MGYVIIAAVLFAAGAGTGFLAVIVLAIHREERHNTMTLDAPDTITRGARAATGMHARRPGVLYEPAYYYHHRQPPPSDREW